MMKHARDNYVGIFYRIDDIYLEFEEKCWNFIDQMSVRLLVTSLIDEIIRKMK
jgi:hypothetical protein